MLQSLFARSIGAFPEASVSCARILGSALASQSYAGLTTSAICCAGVSTVGKKTVTASKSTSKTASTKESEVKRAPSAYNLFLKQNFASLRAETPAGSKAAEVMKLAAAKFKSLPESAKEKYVSEAKKLGSQVAAQRAAIKEKNKAKMGAYAHFVSDNYPQVKAASPGQSFQDISKKLAAKWKGLSDNEKLSYKRSA